MLWIAARAAAMNRMQIVYTTRPGIAIRTNRNESVHLAQHEFFTVLMSIFTARSFLDFRLSLSLSLSADHQQDTKMQRLTNDGAFRQQSGQNCTAGASRLKIMMDAQRTPPLGLSLCSHLAPQFISRYSAETV